MAKAKPKAAAKAPAKTQKQPPAKAEKKRPAPAPAVATAPQDWSEAIRKAVQGKKQPKQYPGGGDSWKRKPRP